MIKKIRKGIFNPEAFLRDSKVKPLSFLGEKLTHYQCTRYLEKARKAADTRVAVIMTAYETGALLKKAADSILTQSHDNLELWIIDDCSKDDTPDIIASIARSDPRVKAWRSPVNHGTYWSKNWCLKKTDAPIVAFQDSDDVSLPDRLRIQLGFLLSDAQSLACTCRWTRILENGNVVNVDGQASRVAAISLMIKAKPVLGSVGYFDSVRISADSEYLARIRKIHGRRALAHLHTVLYQGVLRENSLTRGEGSGFLWETQGAQLFRQRTGARRLYHDSFQVWHRSSDFLRQSRIHFPCRDRLFDAPVEIRPCCDDTDLNQVYPL